MEIFHDQRSCHANVWSAKVIGNEKPSEKKNIFWIYKIFWYYEP